MKRGRATTAVAAVARRRRSRLHCHRRIATPTSPPSLHSLDLFSFFPAPRSSASSSPLFRRSPLIIYRSPSAFILLDSERAINAEKGNRMHSNNKNTITMVIMDRQLCRSAERARQRSGGQRNKGEVRMNRTLIMDISIAMLPALVYGLRKIDSFS